MGVTVKKRDCPIPFPKLITREIVVYGTSTIHQTIFITKMTVLSGPFFELENACPLEISITFRTGKGIAQAGPFFELENDCPQINDMLVLPLNLESFFPFN
jgi:hypothetical protein